MVAMASLWLLGTRVVARVTLRGVAAEERAERLARFDSTVLSRALLVLYLVYPGVSVAVFQCFSCTRLESGASFLDADVRITCWDATHRRYVGGAIVWLLLVPVGVPAFFTWLLHRFRVPQMAQRLEQNAWLRAAVAHAWREGLAQPPGAAALAVDTIPARHLEGLYALFVCGREAEEASDILAGKAPPVTDEEADESAGADAAAGGVAVRITAWLRSAQQRFAARGNGQRAEAAAPDEATAAAARREFLLAALLRWCETSGVVSIPVILWEMADAEEEAAELQDAPPEPAASLVDAQRPAAASELRSKDVPQLLVVALKECGCVAAHAC